VVYDGKVNMIQGLRQCEIIREHEERRKRLRLQKTADSYLRHVGWSVVVAASQEISTRVTIFMFSITYFGFDIFL
jgi:hypothetical protein